MSDLISRQAVINTLDFADNALTDEERTVEKYKELLMECIKVLPSADVRENIHGEWIKMGQGYVCSRCSTTCAVTEMADACIYHTNDRFCRGCGADMRGD